MPLTCPLEDRKSKSKDRKTYRDTTIGRVPVDALRLNSFFTHRGTAIRRHFVLRLAFQSKRRLSLHLPLVPAKMVCREQPRCRRTRS
jgi:hypothetical protein